MRFQASSLTIGWGLTAFRGIGSTRGNCERRQGIGDRFWREVYSPAAVQFALKLRGKVSVSSAVEHWNWGKRLFLLGASAGSITSPDWVQRQQKLLMGVLSYF